MATRTNPDLTTSTSKSLLSLPREGEQGLIDRSAQNDVLKQLIALFEHILDDDEQYGRRIWVEGVEEAVAELQSNSPIIAETARIIISAIEQAVWGFENEEWLGSVNAILSAMKHTTQALQADLKQAKDNGSNLSSYRDPADSVDSPESEDEGVVPEISTTKANTKKSRAKTTSTPARGRPPRFTDHGRIWADAEILHLLRIVRDNFHQSWDERVRAHNESYVVPAETTLKHPRTQEGVKQRLQHEIGSVKPEGMEDRINRKIEELEAQLK